MNLTTERTKRIPKADIALKEYWRDNDRFADLFNQVLFHGQEIIISDNLNENDSDESAVIGYNDGTSESVGRHRDIIKSYGDGINLVIAGIENQKHVHYGMPVRNMIYDSLNYVKQCKQAGKMKNGKTGSDEFLSGMKKDDKINPLISIIIYYGEQNDWDGPIYLSDMMSIPAEIRPYFNDYKLNIINIRNTVNYGFKNKDNKEFFGISRYLYKVGKKIDIEDFNKVFPEVKLNYDTLAAIGAVTGSEGFMKMSVRKKGEEIIMCEALKALEEKGELRGIEKGIEKVNRLNEYLISEGKLEELKKATSDNEYQNKLLQKYGFTKISNEASE